MSDCCAKKWNGPRVWSAAAILAVTSALAAGCQEKAAPAPAPSDGPAPAPAPAPAADPVKRGEELFHAPSFGKKACAGCHVDPKKPNMNLATREFTYPAMSKRLKRVVTLREKINEMIEFNVVGTPLPADAPDLAALEAYVLSLRPKK